MARATRAGFNLSQSDLEDAVASEDAERIATVIEELAYRKSTAAHCLAHLIGCEVKAVAESKASGEAVTRAPYKQFANLERWLKSADEDEVAEMQEWAVEDVHFSKPQAAKPRKGKASKAKAKPKSVTVKASKKAKPSKAEQSMRRRLYMAGWNNASIDGACEADAKPVAQLLAEEIDAGNVKPSKAEREAYAAAKPSKAQKAKAPRKGKKARKANRNPHEEDFDYTAPPESKDAVAYSNVVADGDSTIPDGDESALLLAARFLQNC